MTFGDRLTPERLRDIVQDAHLNFLVGAGASADLCDPLGDIENILTDLDRRKNSGEDVTVARASVYAKYFDGAIVKNSKLLDPDAAASAVLGDYQNFLSAINRVLVRRRSSILNKQVNLFTTNIDLTLEVALERLGSETNDGFVGKFNPIFNTSNFGSLKFRRSLQYENLSEVPTFNIVKIHGSVSWRPDEVEPSDGSLPDIHFDAQLSLVSATARSLDAARSGLVQVAAADKLDLDEILAKASELPLTPEVTAFMAQYEKLAVVNPTKDKFRTTVLNQNYYELFRLFTNELEKENSVLFVLGFSFRDEHIRQLVIRAARANPTLQVFIFCYRSTTEAELRLLIDDAAVKHGNIEFVTPDPQPEGKDEEALNLKTITAKYFSQIVVDRDPESPPRAATAPEHAGAEEADHDSGK